MRDFVADLLSRLQGTNRQQRLYLALGAVVLIVVLRYGTTWFFDYRDGVKADIRLSAQRLASAEKLLERAPQTQQQLNQLRNRYRATVAELVPGETPTLAAAELQDRISNLAAKNGVRIQTTQVLKDEAVGPFREVSLRVTASGEIRNLAGLLSELEFGDLRVTIPFLELSRRGASIRRRSKPSQARAVSATFQVAGIVAGSAALPDMPQAEPAPAPPKVRQAVAAPDGTLPAERARPPREPAPDGTLPNERARPSRRSRADPVADRPAIPDDPLGTARTVTPQ